MSELDEAITRLEQAVARLEAAASGQPRPAADATAAIAGRIDAALAKLQRLLDEEG